MPATECLKQVKVEDLAYIAGLFDGDGFVKVKHEYSIDVGISYSINLKGYIIRKILKICEEKGEVKAEEENGKHYIIDIASPRGIYTALTKLAETKNAEIEGYIIRIIGNIKVNQ